MIACTIKPKILYSQCGGKTISKCESSLNLHHIFSV